MNYKKRGYLENLDFNHIIPKEGSRKRRKLNTDLPAIPKELGTVKRPGSQGFGKLSPELRKKLKLFKQRRET